MAFFIRPKRSNVAGKVPGQAGEANKFSLVGEIAINLKDQVIYVKSPDSDLDSDLGRFEKGVKVAGRVYRSGRGVTVDSTAGTVKVLDQQTFDSVVLSNDSDNRVFSGNEFVTRRYVDAVTSNGGLNIHQPTVVAWDSDINALTTTQGTNLGLSNGDRILVIGPADANGEYGATYAGIYNYNTANSPIPLSRARDFLNDSESVINAGEFVFVRSGNFGGTGFVVLADVPVDATQSASPEQRFPTDPNSGFGTATNVQFGVFSGASTAAQIQVGTTAVQNSTSNIQFTGAGVTSVTSSGTTVTVDINQQPDSDWYMGDSLAGFTSQNNSLDIISRGGQVTASSGPAGQTTQVSGNIVIGSGAISTAYDGAIVLGAGARADSENAIAIGAGAIAQERNSAAIGAGAVATNEGEIRLGGTNSVGATNPYYVSIDTNNFNAGVFEDTVNDPNMLITKGYVDRQIGGLDSLEDLNGVLVSSEAFLTPRILLKPRNSDQYIESPLTIDTGDLATSFVDTDSDTYSIRFNLNTSNTTRGTRVTDSEVENTIFLGPVEQFDDIDSDLNPELIDPSIPNIFTRAPTFGGSWVPIPLAVDPRDSEEYPVFDNNGEIEALIFTGQSVTVTIGGIAAFDTRGSGAFVQFGIQRFDPLTNTWNLITTDDGILSQTTPSYYRPLSINFSNDGTFLDDNVNAYNGSTRFCEPLIFLNRNGNPFTFTFTANETSTIRLRAVARSSSVNSTTFFLPNFTRGLTINNSNFVTESANSSSRNHFHGTCYDLFTSTVQNVADAVNAGTLAVDSDGIMDLAFSDRQSNPNALGLLPDSDVEDHGLVPFGQTGTVWNRGANTQFTTTTDHPTTPSYDSLSLTSTAVNILPSFNVHRSHNLDWGRGKGVFNTSHFILGTKRYNNDINQLGYDYRYMQGNGVPSDHITTFDSDRVWAVDLPPGATLRPTLGFRWLAAQRGGGASGRALIINVDWTTDSDGSGRVQTTTTNWTNILSTTADQQTTPSSFRTSLDENDINDYIDTNSVFGTSYTNTTGRTQRLFMRQTFAAQGSSNVALVQSILNPDSEYYQPRGNFNALFLSMRYTGDDALPAGIEPLNVRVVSTSEAQLFRREEYLPPIQDSEASALVYHSAQQGRTVQLFDLVEVDNPGATTRTVNLLTDGSSNALRNGHTYIVRVRNANSTLPAGTTVNFNFLNNGEGGAQTPYFDPLNRGASVLISPHADGGIANAGNIVNSPNNKDIVFRIHVYDATSNDVVIVRES